MNFIKDKAFLDTNILVYVYSDNEPDKQAIAMGLISDAETDYIISTQVIGELVNILFRKFGCDISSIRVAVKDFRESLQLREVQSNTIDGALWVMEKYHFSYWDSLIISSALENQCTILYSEDLQHRQEIESRLTIVNPFL